MILLGKLPFYSKEKNTRKFFSNLLVPTVDGSEVQKHFSYKRSTHIGESPYLVPVLQLVLGTHSQSRFLFYFTLTAGLDPRVCISA